MAALVKLRNHLGLTERVDFAGRLSDGGDGGAPGPVPCGGLRAGHEDYGFVTVEAFRCGKPVVTCTDSGGPAELVRRRTRTGWSPRRRPKPLAAARCAM